MSIESQSTGSTEPAWITKIFDAKEARSGGVVRRQKNSVEENASVEALKTAVTKRQFHLLELVDQYVIICDPSDMTIIVR